MRGAAWPRVDPAAAPLLERLRTRLSEAELEARLAESREAFGGLLDDEALALLLLDELGMNEGAYVTIADLPGRAEATVRVTLEGIEPVRTFQRGSGGEGRVVNCLVSDATGSARMVLWDRDVEKTEDGTLRPRCRLTLVNARVKEGRFGTELHVGPWTVLDVEGALDPARRKLLQDVAVAEGEAAPRAAATQTTLPPAEEGPATVEGTLAGLAPTRSFKRGDGGVGFVCDADVDTPQGRVRLVAWDEAVKAVRALAPGARLVAENVVPKVRGAATEWHTTKESRIRAG